MVSVLLPVYNQYDALDITLEALTQQDYSESFEVVVVDDRSDTIRKDIIDKYSSLSCFSLLFVENAINMGRAATRNILINRSCGDILIFCDADRFPSSSFIADHVQCIQKMSHSISVGKVMETYESPMKIKKLSGCSCVSRKAVYYKTIQKLFDSNGMSDSSLVWLAFLSGNVAIRRNDLGEERFDESFREWGFEHFELGYRLFQRGLKIILNSGAINTHIAHARSGMNYKTYIKDSYVYFYSKYSNITIKYLYDFIVGKISLQEYELKSSGPKVWMENKAPIYNVII